MSDQPPNEHPGLTPKRNVESAVRDSFPASDAPATTATQGVRAVPPQRMMEDANASPPGLPADAPHISQAFPDAESAKLCLEHLVREGPLDRRCAEIRPGEDGRGATLMLTVPAGDRDRLEALLRQDAGLG